MTRLGVRHIALVLSMAAIAAAGCGSSSKSKSTVSPAAPSTPATPSTASTSTTAKLTPSTPITDPALHGALVAAARKSAPASITNAQLNEVVSCVVKKYEAKGVKTAGELAQHQSEAESFGAQCATQLGIK
jgi:hypothetical protein